MELKGKRVLVVGLAKSGIASALFLKEHGATVTATDAKSEAALGGSISDLRSKGITLQTGEDEPNVAGFDLVVVSPGVPITAPAVQQAQARSIPVIGEVELAAQFLKGRIVAITGSNGKTTTTALTGEVLARSGKKTLVGGNIGTPAISLVAASTDDGHVVLEVSSFQLETIHTFRPFVSVVLNITPDHLDRHGSMETYIAAKARIFENQTRSDFAVLNFDDATCRSMAARLHQASGPAIYWFSRLKEVDRGASVRDGRILWRDGTTQREIMLAAEIPLKGAHNLENVLAAISAGMLTGCQPADIARSVRAFKAVEHRLEFVATVRGVQYFNDSKATNVDATVKALESFPANIHLILGGKDKGSDYTVLTPLTKSRVKRIYTIGAAAQKIESQLKGSAEIASAGTLSEAVRQASESATPGDIVLLAPACASFDQFENYEHRGRTFKELVCALSQRLSAAGDEPREAAS